MNVRIRSLLLPVWIFGLALSACDGAPDKPDKDPPPRPSATAAGSATASASAAPTAKATATATAAAKGGGDSGLAGTWEGAYDAKKGSVSLPPKVKDKALAADDGKKASGAGTIEIVIDAAGEVKGRGRGALGACTITGKAEESLIRATVLPDDPRAPDAMTGVLVGTIKGDVIKGEIRVAGPDATMVRESAIELKRKQ